MNYLMAINHLHYCAAITWTSRYTGFVCFLFTEILTHEPLFLSKWVCRQTHQPWTNRYCFDIRQFFKLVVRTDNSNSNNNSYNNSNNNNNNSTTTTTTTTTTTNNNIVTAFTSQ